MKILNFGSCNVDYVYTLDHIVKEGETETSFNLEIFPGGKGLNQSIALARAGAPVFHAGLIGEDGEFLQDILSDSGVDTGFMQRVSAKNGHAIIQVTTCGENAIFLYPGSNEMLCRAYIDGVLQNFGADDMLLLQNEINDVDYIAKKAYEKGMKIVFNPSPFNEKILKVDFHKLFCLILNEVEAKEITGFDEPEKILTFFKERYPNLKVMLTLGINGSIYADGESKLYQSVFKVEAVDTTAAGDTFTGYFVAGLYKGMHPTKILKLASAASAIAVSRKGAAPSIPIYDEVLAALKKLKAGKTITKARLLQKKIFDYAEENIQNANLPALAEKLGYSVVYTGSLVKKLTGEPFAKYLQNKRCEMAANKLLSSDLPIGEIIRAVGYENESHFRKIFREKYGANPLEFRKNGR